MNFAFLPPHHNERQIVYFISTFCPASSINLLFRDFIGSQPKFLLRKKQHIERNREFFAGNADISVNHFVCDSRFECFDKVV